MDHTSLILSELSLLSESEKKNRNPFKARAYDRVIQSIRQLDRPILSMADLKGVEGMGKSIQSKIQEMIEMGGSRAAQEVRADPRTAPLEMLQGIYGIGPAHSRTLLEKYPGVRTIQDVREILRFHPEAFTKHQRAGIQWYEDLRERIPRSEMQEHDRFLRKLASKHGLEMELCGSYRRGNPDSGDIDCILTHSSLTSYETAQECFQRMVKELLESGYIQHILAQGQSKVLCINRLSLSYPGRRLDLLLTDRTEYPYAILYFTGSQRLNIQMRKRALELGYTLNEHEMKPLDSKNGRFQVDSEEGIFEALGMPYLSPSERNI